MEIDAGLVADPGDNPDIGVDTVADAGVVADAVVVAVAAADVDNIIILGADAGSKLEMNTLFADAIVYFFMEILLIWKSKNI